MNRQAMIDYYRRRLHSPFSPDDSVPEKIHQLDTDNGYTFLFHEHAGIRIDIERNTPLCWRFPNDAALIRSRPEIIHVTCENPGLFLVIDPQGNLINDYRCKMSVLESEIEKERKEMAESFCCALTSPPNE